MKIPQEIHCLGPEDLNASARKKDKRPYLCPKISIQPIQLDFNLMVTSTHVRTGGPGNVPQVEDWEDSGGTTRDFDF